MTYEEYSKHLRERGKTPGREAAEQEIDEEISLVSQLPCTGGGTPTPLFDAQRESAAFSALALDQGEKFPGQPCLHCTWLAAFKWIKSAHVARRNGLPEPPLP